jgi:hypothetical protein
MKNTATNNNSIPGEIQSRISRFFPGKGKSETEWMSIYSKGWGNPHFEPWLTMMSALTLFPSVPASEGSIEAFNNLLKLSGARTSVNIRGIRSVEVERTLPAVGEYDQFLRTLHSEGRFHQYPDRADEIDRRVVQEDARKLESGSNIDLIIEAESTQGLELFLIEAKFLSDISYMVRYSPVRDQIIRNIDSGINEARERSARLHFLLLTPAAFKTEEFGGHDSESLDALNPDRSRLYCYKMNEYRNPDRLREALPHRADEIHDWNELAGTIGWISFEEVLAVCMEAGIIEEAIRRDVFDFFDARNISVGHH